MTGRTASSADVPAQSPGYAEDAVHTWPTDRLLSVAARLVGQSWHAFLATRGLTRVGFTALHLLAAGPLPQRELARRAGATEQAMGRTVERLSRGRLVARAVDPKDRRRTLVTVTDRGRAVHAEVVRAEREDPAVLGAAVDHEALRGRLVDLVTALGADRARDRSA